MLKSALFLLFFTVSAPAYAAEATLVLSANLLDCKTYEKAQAACDNQGKCCKVAERKKGIS